MIWRSMGHQRRIHTLRWTSILDTMRWRSVRFLELEYKLLPLHVFMFFTIMFDCFRLIIAALLGVSVRTHFINNGARENGGKLDKTGTYVKDGVYVGLVGARFERPNLMEWKHMIITKEQNTVENGYGKKGSNELLNIWASFYKIEFFPTWAEANDEVSLRDFRNYKALQNDRYLNKHVYKERVRVCLFSLRCTFQIPLHS